MNPLVIRDELLKHSGDRVLVKIFGMRNKNDKFIGTLKDIYPQIFTVDVDGTIRSFSYAELINGEVTLSFI